MDSQQWRFHLHELVEKTIYCPFRCLLKRLAHTERRHDEHLGVLDLHVNVHDTVTAKDCTAVMFSNCRNHFISTNICKILISMSKSANLNMSDEESQ